MQDKRLGDMTTWSEMHRCHGIMRARDQATCLHNSRSIHVLFTSDAVSFLWISSPLHNPLWFSEHSPEMPTRLWFLWQPAPDGIALQLICVATSLALFQWHGVMQVLQIHFARDVHFFYGIRIIYKLDKLPLFCIGTRFSGGIPLPLISLLFHTSANPFHPENSCKQIIIK